MDLKNLLWRNTRRKTVATTLIATAIGAVLWYAKAPDNVNRDKYVLPQSPGEAYTDLDTDKDGLKDWEEQVYRTDSNNPDTDGDGTNDGEEIRLNRDPLKPPPDDIAMPKAAAGDNQNKPDSTDEFTRKMLERYLAEKQAGGTFDPGEFSSRIVAEAESASGGSLNFTPIGANDLKIFSSKNQSDAKIYLNRVAQIFLDKILTGQPGPMQTLASILQRDNYEDQLYRLDPFIENLDSAASVLKSTRVPSSWSQEHIQLINNLLESEAALKVIRANGQDILLVLKTVKPYQASQASLIDLLKAVQRRVHTEQLVFDKGGAADRLIQSLSGNNQQ